MKHLFKKKSSQLQWLGSRILQSLSSFSLAVAFDFPQALTVFGNQLLLLSECFAYLPLSSLLQNTKRIVKGALSFYAFKFWFLSFMTSESICPWFPILVYAFQLICFVLQSFIAQPRSGLLFFLIQGFPNAFLLTCCSFLLLTIQQSAFFSEAKCPKAFSFTEKIKS